MKSRIEHIITDSGGLKLCSSCKQWSSLEYYNKDSSRWDGLNHHCKNCDSKRYVEYISDPDVRIKRSKVSCAWDKLNRPRRRQTAKLWRDTHRDHRNAVNRVWVERNRDKVQKSNREFDSRRYATEKGRIDVLIATGMRHCLKNGKSECHWEDIVGYNWKQLKTRLIFTTPFGYKWEDFMKGELHIDHKIPKRVFNYETPDDIDFKRCWALQNLQLLPAKINMSKQGKLDRPFQPSLAIAI